MKRPIAISAVIASASIASSGIAYGVRDQGFEVALAVAAILAAVFGFFGYCAGDE